MKLNGVIPAFHQKNDGLNRWKIVWSRTTAMAFDNVAFSSRYVSCWRLQSGNERNSFFMILRKKHLFSYLQNKIIYSVVASQIIKDTWKFYTGCLRSNVPKCSYRFHRSIKAVKVEKKIFCKSKCTSHIKPKLCPSPFYKATIIYNIRIFGSIANGTIFKRRATYTS